MTLSALERAIQILRPYYANGDGHFVDASHDEISFTATDKPLSHDHVIELRGLGLFQPEVDDDVPYDPQERWACYV